MTILKQLLALSLFLIYSFSITAEDLNFSSEVNKLCLDNNLTFFSQSLIKTINSNSIQVIGISADQTKQKYHEFKGKPVVLLTGAMHPRQETSFLFIKAAIEYIIQEYSKNNPEIRYLLRRITLLVIPFVNIDAIKYKIQNFSSNLAQMRKNMNNINGQKCQKTSDKGVDINRNFNYNYGQLKSSQSPCSQQYRGIEPFSQPQSRAILRIFQQFQVKTNIDVHSYGNLWIYPYASEADPHKIEKHHLYPIYKQVFQKFDQQNITYANCYESLKYIADGVYIDWALFRNSISFAFEFGDDFSKVGNDLDKHIQALMTVLQANNDFFQYYLEINEQVQQSKRQDTVLDEKNVSKLNLCIKSLSTLTHEVILMVNGQSKETIEIRSRQIKCFAQIFNLSLYKSTNISSRRLQDQSVQIQPLNPEQNVSIKIKNSLIFRNINLRELKIQKSQSIQNLHFQSFAKSLKIFIIVIGIIYLVSTICGVSLLCERVLRWNYMHNQELATESDDYIIHISQPTEASKKGQKQIETTSGTSMQRKTNQQIKTEDSIQPNE